MSERQWRSAANRSPLPLRSVLAAPPRGAGPELAGETGVGFANLFCVMGEKGNCKSPLAAGCATTDCGFPPDCPQEGKKDRTGAENREKNLLTGREFLGYNGYSQGK